MHLFLQGDIGIGKSTLLRQALAQHKIMPGGLITQRLLEGDSIVGFRVLTLADSLPSVQTQYFPGMEGVFMLKGRHNSHMLAEAITWVEQQNRQQPYSLLLLDEIGGIELADPLFSECLQRILLGSVPCLGVLKSAANLLHTTKAFQLDAKYQAMHENLVRLLCENGKLLTLHKGNYEIIRQHVEKYLAETR